MIGRNATVMAGAVIGTQSIVGAGSFVSLGGQVPAGSMIVGAPARVFAPLTEVQRGYPRFPCDICLRFVEWHGRRRSLTGRRAGSLPRWIGPPL
jgi:carbonic anhydrase/acetyltransferase-like protein (isoleucine patch superfamily)